VIENEGRADRHPNALWSTLSALTGGPALSSARARRSLSRSWLVDVHVPAKVSDDHHEALARLVQQLKLKRLVQPCAVEEPTGGELARLSPSSPNERHAHDEGAFAFDLDDYYRNNLRQHVVNRSRCCRVRGGEAADPALDRIIAREPLTEALLSRAGQGGEQPPSRRGLIERKARYQSAT
jgi:hypothetical protein